MSGEAVLVVVRRSLDGARVRCLSRVPGRRRRVVAPLLAPRRPMTETIFSFPSAVAIVEGGRTGYSPVSLPDHPNGFRFDASASRANRSKDRRGYHLAPRSREFGPRRAVVVETAKPDRRPRRGMNYQIPPRGPLAAPWPVLTE